MSVENWRKERAPSSLVLSKHGTSPNDLLQFNYIEIAPFWTGKNIRSLVAQGPLGLQVGFCFRDHIGRKRGTGHNRVGSVIRLLKIFLFDSPTHLKNETMLLVTKGLIFPHQFTLSYSPWIGGTVDRLGMVISFQTIRSVCSELQLCSDMWFDLLSIVQRTLNYSPSLQRADISSGHLH